MNEPPLLIEREMSLTREEFLRPLPLALAGRIYRHRDGPVEEVDIEVAERKESRRRIRISAIPLPERKVGALSLPRLLVRFAFNGYERDEALSFLAGFGKYYLRGGG